MKEDLAARDQRDSQRASAPLMIPLGARIINNSGMTPEDTSRIIIEDVRQKLKEREDKVTDGEIADAIVANAPGATDHFFVVPKVVE